jgi:Cd2+/Zn2+-exporting ATPase
MVAELWSDDSHMSAISQTPANTPCTSCASDAPTLPERVAVSEQVVFKVHGMDCGDEVAALKREVGPIVGGEDKLAFDLVNGRMSVIGRADRLPVEQIEKAVLRTGMTAEPWQEGATSEATIAEERRRRTQTLLTTASGILAAAGLGLHAPLAVASLLPSAQPKPQAAHLCRPLRPTLSRSFVPFATWLPEPYYRLDVCDPT